MSELRTWYEKVTGDDAASAYVLCPLGLPSSQFTEGRAKGLSRRERDQSLVGNLSRYSNWRITWRYYSLYTRRCGGVRGFRNSGCQ
jgi:hypothetical protein